MDTRSLGIDPLSGLETIMHYDDATDISTFEYRQDITPIIDLNKALHNSSFQRDGIKEDMVHAAIIPPGVQMIWMTEHGVKDVYADEYWPIVRRLLNSPDYRYLKTGSMKL
jgi:hypothetical protein